MWINEKNEIYGKSVVEMLDEPELLSDPKLIALILADGKKCPSEEECVQINESLKVRYIPKGLTLTQRKRLLALYEIVNRIGIRKGVQLKTPQKIYEYVKHYAYEEQEHLIVLGFNGSGELLCCDVVTKGLADKTIVHPREVFKNVIRNSGLSIVLVHNHPSGNISPSDADINMTEKINEAGKLLGIKVLDHLIISTDGYYSFRENGDM